MDFVLRMDVLKNHISVTICTKILKLCDQASLTETLMWTKLQVKIRNFDVTGKL